MASSRSTTSNQEYKAPKQKIVIIYHGGCPDGFGGAWAAWKKFKDKAAYIPAHDRFSLPAPLKRKEIYLIDYTYTEDLLEVLIRDNDRVTAIDHHITSEAAAKMTDQYSFALNHSGATLAWKYFHPKKPMPHLLRYIEDRDIWKWNVPLSREMLMMIDMTPKEFGAWDRLARELDNPRIRAEYKGKGRLLARYERAILDDIASNAERVRFAGYEVYAVNAPARFADDLGSEFAKKSDSFSIIWRESQGIIKVSLRSRHGIDVSRIAGRYGGGGHKSSSGFSFPAGQKFPWKILRDGTEK